MTILISQIIQLERQIICKRENTTESGEQSLGISLSPTTNMAGCPT